MENTYVKEENKIEVCRLCLDLITCQEIYLLDSVAQNILEDIIPQLNLDLNHDPKMCETCNRNMLACYEFKSICDNREIIDVKIKIEENTDVSTLQVKGRNCEFCTNSIDNNEEISPCEEFYNEYLQSCLPEWIRKRSKNAVPCKSCSETLKGQYTFLRICLETEEKIKKYGLAEGTNIQEKIDLHKVLHFVLSNKNEAIICKSPIDNKFSLFSDNSVNVKTEIDDSLPIKLEDIEIKSEEIFEDECTVYIEQRETLDEIEVPSGSGQGYSSVSNEIKMDNILEFNNMDVENISEPKIKRIKIIPKKWVYYKSFRSKAEAETFVQLELCWSLKNTNCTELGKVKYFRCNKVKSRGEQCTAGIKLIFDSNSALTLLFRADKHSCDNISIKAFSGIHEDIKGIIEDLFEKKIKPKAIFENLSEKFDNPPTIRQINNYLVQLRRSLYGSPTISLGELENWLQTNSQIPDDYDNAFVFNYVIDDEGDEIFRFAISSKRLLQNALRSDGNLVLHADATYKLIWQGFPVLLLGMTDYNRKFHLLGIAVCSDEKSEDFEFIFNSFKIIVHRIFNVELKPKVLVADAAPSIKNGFQIVFGNCSVRMCWAHMRRCVLKKALILAAKSNVKKIIADVDFIQMSENDTAFLRSCNLFFKKWSKEKKFIKYFKEEWIDQNLSWYEGYCPGTPSTNNALKSTNRVLKDEYALRERLPLGRFCHLIKNVVQSFSKRYVNGSLYFSEAITYTTKLWTSAYQWARLNKKVQLTADNIYLEYLIPSGDNLEVDPNNVNTDAKDFDEYVQKKSTFYKLYFPKVAKDWQRGHCTCAFFLKTHVCKHIVGAAIKFKYVYPPAEVKHLLIGEKRKRGRPPKAKKALIIG